MTTESSRNPARKFLDSAMAAAHAHRDAIAYIGVLALAAAYILWGAP